VCHDCHGGNLPLGWPYCKRFPSARMNGVHGIARARTSCAGTLEFGRLSGICRVFPCPTLQRRNYQPLPAEQRGKPDLPRKPYGAKLAFERAGLEFVQEILDFRACVGSPVGYARWDSTWSTERATTSSPNGIHPKSSLVFA
jgi:hypothetical protein